MLLEEAGQQGQGDWRSKHAGTAASTFLGGNIMRSAVSPQKKFIAPIHGRCSDFTSIFGPFGNRFAEMMRRELIANYIVQRQQ